MKTLSLRPGCQRGFTLVELLTTLAILGLIMTGLLNVYMTSDIIGRTGANKAEAQQDARAAMLIDEKLRLAGYGVPSTLATITAASPTSITFWGDLQNASTILAAGTTGTTLQVNNAAGIAAGNTIYLINGGQVATLTVTAVDAASAPNTITVQAGPAVAYPRGAQVGRPRQVTYSWNAGTQTLSMNAGDGTGLQPLSTGIQNLQFNYFDMNGAAIAPATLTANLGNIRRIQITVTAQSAATRNRGTFTMISSVRPRNL